jgi:predicted HNH restriction endonuclease
MISARPDRPRALSLLHADASGEGGLGQEAGRRGCGEAGRGQKINWSTPSHYGLHCQACGLVPKVAQQIEVHHLDPISEGVRRTRLEDLRPLCRNCHSLAHSTNPPMPVEKVAQLAAA